MSKKLDPIDLLIRMALAPDRRTKYYAGRHLEKQFFWDVTGARRKAANDIARRFKLSVVWPWLGMPNSQHGVAIKVTRARTNDEPRFMSETYYPATREIVVIVQTPSELAAWLLAYHEEHKSDGHPAEAVAHPAVCGYPAG